MRQSDQDGMIPLLYLRANHDPGHATALNAAEANYVKAAIKFNGGGKSFVTANHVSSLASCNSSYMLSISGFRSFSRFFPPLGHIDHSLSLLDQLSSLSGPGQG